MSSRLFAPLAAVLALTHPGCADPPGGGVDSSTPGHDGGRPGDASVDAAPRTLLALSITPPDTFLEVDLDSPTSQAFVVTASYSDGTDADVSTDVSWTVSDPAVGAMTGATLEVPGFAMRTFASTLVTATLDGADATAQVTVAAYVRSGDSPDAVLVVPFGSATPSTVDLTFATELRSMDVFFNVDTTASMDGEVSNLQANLTSSLVSAIRAAVPDTWFGIGAYEDFPISPYGESDCTYGALGGPDQPFELLTLITGDLTELGIGVSRLGIGGNAIGCGNDIPESAVEAMFQIATGGGLSSPPPTSVASGTTSIGGVSFREGTLPVVVNITDAISHHSGASACPGVTYTNARVAEVAADEATALRALEGICAQVVQIASDVSGSCNAYNDGVTYTTRLGGVVPPSAWDVLGRPPGCAAGLCCTGAAGAGVAPVAGVCPLTYVIPANGSGLSTAIANAVHVLALFAPFDVTAEWEGGAADEAGGALPAGTTSADFIDGATPLSFGTSPLTGTDPTLTETTFQGVVPGTDVTFTVSATNDFVEQTNTARTFLVAVRALAGACRTLDERTVYVLVPPAPPD